MYSVLFHLSLVSALLLPVSLNAQVFGEAARTEFMGGFGFRTFYSRINKTRLLVDGESMRGPDAPKVFVNMAPVAVVYGARPGLSLILMVPTIVRSFEQTRNGTRITQTDAGVGDLTFLAKYRFYKKDSFFKSRQIAVQAGLKFPTGPDDLKDAQGAPLPQPMQLGSGSVDGRFALTFTEARKRWFFTGDLGYELNTAGDDFEFGDVVRYDLAVKFRFHPARFKDGPLKQHFVFLELNGLINRKARSKGVELANSGGHQIFLAPGVQIFLLENVLLEAGIQLPLVQNLNGRQLGTDFNLRIGMRWVIVP
ncbi:MAG: transporter [bacterium]